MSVARAAGVTAAVVLVAAIPFLHAWLAYPGPVQVSRSVEENVNYSADLAGYFVPGHNSVVYGALAPQRHPERRFFGEEIFPGYLPWLLVPFAFVRKEERRRVWPWVILAAVFLILSLGPVLKVAGASTGLPLPYWLLYEIVPLLKASRTPVRYAAPFLLFLSLVAAFGARHLAGRWRWRPLLLVVLAVGVGESLFTVSLVSREPAPAIYEQIAATDRDDVVLNVPLYHARVDRRIMYHQLFHRRPLTSACIPRASTAPHGLIQGTQLRACLLEPGACDRADPRLVRREIAERRIRFVLFHTRYMTPDAIRTGDELLRSAGALERIEDPSGIVAYRF
jgi:hypothetical protein